jgi:ribosome-associated protein
MTKLSIYTPTIRLKDALKFAGEAENGGAAKMMIKEEQIKVNGEICTVCGKQLGEGDTFEVDGLTYEIHILK